MELDRTLWLTADRSAVVEDGDALAAFLLGTKGKKVSDAEAERLGLLKAKAAPANKMRKPSADK